MLVCIHGLAAHAFLMSCAMFWCSLTVLVRHCFKTALHCKAASLVDELAAESMKCKQAVTIPMRRHSCAIPSSSNSLDSKFAKFLW